MNSIATMGEGNTPLVQSVGIGPRHEMQLSFKMELCNPSGSYKDRFVAREITYLRTQGVRTCVATSSGNTGAALAAYCTRYGIGCAILVNEHAPSGKLRQMQRSGARIFRVRDFVTSPDVTQSVYRRLQEMAILHSVRLVVSAYRYCPEGMKGVEDIGTELISQCATRPDHIFVPVGGGGLFTAVCRGLTASGKFETKVHAVQPEGCATVVSAYEQGRDEILPLVSTTRVSGLAVPFDMDAGRCLVELRKCGGRGIAVSDVEVFAAQRRMMREEGIWCEPAGAAGLAGCLRAREQGWMKPGESALCVVSGHGFKDADFSGNASDENASMVIEESQVVHSLFEGGR